MISFHVNPGKGSVLEKMSFMKLYVRGAGGRENLGLMEYIQQNVVVSGEDESATGLSENNQAKGGGTSNSQPTPLSNSDKLSSLSQPTYLQVEVGSVR